MGVPRELSYAPNIEGDGGLLVDFSINDHRGYLESSKISRGVTSPASPLVAELWHSAGVSPDSVDCLARILITRSPDCQNTFLLLSRSVILDGVFFLFSLVFSHQERPTKL